MSQTEDNYVPYKRDSSPFIWYHERKASLPSIELVVKNPKKPIGFAQWPEESKREWKKA